MLRYTIIFSIFLLTGLSLLGTLAHSYWWALILVISIPLLFLGIWDFFQTRHSLLRNYPIIAHFRWLAEAARPELHQYFIESDLGGRPFNRDTRALVYERAENEGNRGHQNRAQADAAGFHRRLDQSLAFLLQIHGELHDQDRVLHRQPDDRDQSDLEVHVILQAAHAGEQH